MKNYCNKIFPNCLNIDIYMLYLWSSWCFRLKRNINVQLEGLEVQSASVIWSEHAVQRQTRVQPYFTFHTPSTVSAPAESWTCDLFFFCNDIWFKWDRPLLHFHCSTFHVSIKWLCQEWDLFIYFFRPLRCLLDSECN